MYCIIEVGGKQLQVSKDKIIKIEKVPLGENGKIEFSNILAVSNGKDIKIGYPVISGYKILGEVLKTQKDPKVIVFKKKKRHNFRKKNGHRQECLIVRIIDIFEENRSE